MANRMDSVDVSSAELDSTGGGLDFAPDLSQFLRMVWRRRWALLACLVVVPAAALALSLHATKVYESSTLMQVSGGSPTGAPTDNVSVGSQAASPTAVDVAARLIQTSGVADAVGEMLHPAPPHPTALLHQISVATDDTTGFLTLAARDHNPERAAAIANGFASAIVQNQTQSAVQALDQAIGQLKAQVHALTDLVQRRQLSAQLQRLRALRAVQSSNIFSVEPATPSSQPVSPRPVRNTLLALLAAVLIGLGLVFVLERLDARVRDADEMESILQSSLLAVVPRQAFRSADRGASREAFHTVRMSLTYFNVDRPLDTVLVTSALKEEGKTTVATNLAQAAATAGRDVILLETDLRRPAIARRMGLSPSFGLSDVLIGKASLFDALIEVEVAAPVGDEIGVGRLRILTCGLVPPNPSALLGSERMRTLLAHLSGSSDLVIIDSAPVLAVSDAVPLIGEASGVIVVGRLNVARRDALRRLHRIVRTAHGTILGVVATGATQEGIYGYGYGYGDYSGANAARDNGGAPGAGGEAQLATDVAANRADGEPAHEVVKHT